MIKVTLLVLGKLKESYLREAIAEYSKRLSRYCSLQIKEFDPVRISDKPSQSEIEAALKKEAQMLAQAIPPQSKTVALCIEGKQHSSEQLAEKIKSAAESNGSITFIIGSSFGLHDSIKQQCELRLSMSEMTFPHQLARVMLLEQIYRGFKILEGSAYHK